MMLAGLNCTKTVPNGAVSNSPISYPVNCPRDETTDLSKQEPGAQLSLS